MPQATQVFPDKRVERSKHSVLKETYKLLWEEGFGGVSVDEVSRRSGVSKTTIYRHWPSRIALLLDACSKIGTKPQAPDTGSLRGDLTVLVAHLAEQLQTARWPAVLPSIIDAAERDPDLARLHSTLQAEMNAPFFEAVERARERGDLSRDQIAADLVASAIAPLFYRRWFSREPFDDKFLSLVIRDAIEKSKR